MYGLAIEGVRHNAMRPEAVKTWFEAVTELCIQHQYAPDQIHDMDESGFAVGESQSSRASVNVRDEKGIKKAPMEEMILTAARKHMKPHFIDSWVTG